MIESSQKFKELHDQWGNVFHFNPSTGLIGRGGQGSVYRTSDVDTAIKILHGRNSGVEKSVGLINRLEVPEQIVKPKSTIFKKEKDGQKRYIGYTMELLSGMESLSSLVHLRSNKEDLKSASEWIKRIDDKEAAARLQLYAQTGSTKSRLATLKECASALALLHIRGLAYGDLSPSNIFVDSSNWQDIKLIDPDNIQTDSTNSGKFIWTPKYGAPETVQKKNGINSQTDIWSFAVIAFQLLSMTHPFLGKKVLSENSEDDGWDSDSGSTAIDDQAYSGYLPFIDDVNDQSNECVGASLPRGLILTNELKDSFQYTLGIGRTLPDARVTLMHWAQQLAEAHDLSLTCPVCNMSYYAENHELCPYCGSPRGEYAVIKGNHWKFIVDARSEQHPVPMRVLSGFNLMDSNEYATTYTLDFEKRQGRPIRGNDALPEDVQIQFVSAFE